MPFERDRFADLVNAVRLRHVFDEKSYPTLEGVSSESKKRVFALQHGLLHVQKRAGAIASALEAYDHSGRLDVDSVRVATAKLLVDTFKLAEEAGMTPHELFTAAMNLCIKKPN
jgi:hypothetical protein